MIRKLLWGKIVWRPLIAFFLALFLIPINYSPTIALDTVNVGGYFEIAYDPVEFSKTEINGDEVFGATIQGVATCTQDLPLTVNEASINGRVIATHQTNGDKVTLNSSYTVIISPFPNNKNETAQSSVDISLQFPDGSNSGDYTVVGELIEARVNVSIIGWLNVTSLLPDSQAMGSLKYIAPDGGGGVGGGGGGFAAAPPSTDEEVISNLFGIEASSPISSSGEILETIETTSEDETLTLTIPEGTIALDKDANPLLNLEAEVNDNPPSPPEDTSIIGLAYDFGPDGATFDPPITLTRSYDPEDIPEDIAEEDLTLAWYNEITEEWIELECTIDTENHTITASIEHFTTFVIICVISPPEPMEPAPTPANFVLSSLSISPLEANIGDEVTISLLVANTGGKSESYDVTLKINGSVAETKEVAVSAGLNKEVIFMTSSDIAGIYSVNIDDLSGSFVVKPATTPVLELVSKPITPAKDTPPSPRPMNRLIVYSVAVALVAMGAILFYLVKRRHTKSGS